MATITVNDNKVIDYLKTIGNINQGGNKALEYFMELNNSALWQLKGKYSEQELKAIIDVMNGTMIDKLWINNNMLPAQIQDGDLYEGLGPKWEINAKDLSSKLEGLNNFQAFFMTLWAYNFWYGNIENKNDLNKYIEKLV